MKGEIQKQKEFKKNYIKINKDKRCDIRILQSVISMKERLSDTDIKIVYIAYIIIIIYINIDQCEYCRSL